jgi:transaldolase
MHPDRRVVIQTRIVVGDFRLRVIGVEFTAMHARGAGMSPDRAGDLVLGRHEPDPAALAYQAYEEVFSSDRWRALEAQGANTQRPLWASTGVKNQDYPDTLYVSDLIAPDTVNTMPEKTLKSYADHGRPGQPIQRTYDEAARVMKAVADAGVDLDDVFGVLEDEGIQKFADSWDELTESVRSELEDKK